MCFEVCEGVNHADVMFYVESASRFLGAHFSILQTTNRHHEHPIRPAIGELATCNDHQERRFAHFRSVHFVSESNEVFRTFLNFNTSQLHLNGSPTVIVQADDKVGFQIVFVAVMENLTIKGLRIDTQITRHQRLKKETEIIEIVQNAFGIGTQNRRGYGRIHKLPLFGSANGRL